MARSYQNRTASTTIYDVFSPRFLRQLESLRIECRRPFWGTRKGEHLTNKKGSSIEFADYKEYMPGDDFKYIDWNVYGRHNKLLVKTFREEEDLPIHLIIDASRSMGVPAADRKFDYAVNLATALAYVGLSNQDSVRAITFADETHDSATFHDSRISPPSGRTHSSRAGSAVSITARRTPFYRRRNSVWKIRSFLESTVPGGLTEFAEFAKMCAHESKGRGGVLVVLSDFLMEPAMYRTGLNRLRYGHYDVKAIQVLGASEIDLSAKRRRLEVIDSETGVRKVIGLSGKVREKYRVAVQKHNDELKKFCRTAKITYALARTDESFEDFLLREFHALGMVR